MARAEDRHWWYLGMAVITSALLQRWLPGGSSRTILDAGCGTGGAMTSFLPGFGRVAGLDLSPLALDFCQQRGAQPLTRGSVTHLPFQSASFDLLTSFDVLYTRTVPDVQAALVEFARVLTPGGHLLLRLPAYNWLRGRHDHAVWTAHRFTRREVAQLLTASGLAVRHTSYANTFLFPFALLKRLGERIFPPPPTASDLSLPPRLLNQIFAILLKAEAPLVARGGLPFGLSVFALAQKT